MGGGCCAAAKPIQPRPETKTQKTPENVKPDTNVKSDPSSTDVPQAKQSVPQEEQGVTQEKQKPGRRDLWKEAYEDLDPDDKKYVPASGSRRASDSTSRAAINGVIEDTKARYTEWKNGGLRIGGNNGGINIRDYTERIVNAALKASDLISMFVSFDPTGHASSAWTVISFGMSVVGNSLDRRDAIFQASDYLSEKLAYYSLIDANYRNQGVGSDHQLDETLLDVYKAILRFTVDVKKAQDESAASRVARSVFPLTDQPLAQLKQAITEQGAVAEKWTYLASDLGNRRAAAIQLASIKSVESRMLKQEERSQVVWLSATDYSRHHRELQDKRTGDTGRWLLNSKEYIDWKYNSGGLLWLPGISGCGKSVLCSTIIQDIQEECEADDAKYLAYWYFEFGDNKTQSVNSMTRSLVRQLSRSPLLPSVTKLCQEYEIKGGEPGSKEINGLFNDMVSSVPGNIYLIFDALDECPENGDSQERETLLRFLQDLLAQHRNKVHILATSRLEQDIKEELGPIVSSTIDLEAYLAEDVKIFVMETMKQSRFKGLSADIKELIEEKLLNSQERRFRWAELQMAAIRKLHVEEDIKKALDTIPRTLEETYMRILNEIEPVNVPLARKILMAICTSHMGLSLDMVADIVGVKSPDSVIEICTTGLISSFDEIVRVAHFSVQEFLVIPEGHSVLPHLECQFSAMDGSRFLATSMVDCLLKQTTVLTPKEALENPFFVHAARYWNIYVAALRDSDPLWCDLQPKVNRLFTEPELYLNWTYVLDFYSQNLPFEYANIHFGNPENQPIQVASRMGFAQTVEELLDRGADTEAIGGASYSPYALCVASGEGHEAVVRILLNRGANFNTGEEQQSTALIAASRGGHKRIVQILLDHGADINTEGSKHGSALNAASEMGHEDIVKLLLDAGASISPQRSRYGALTAASWAGHEHIVQMILDYTKDIDAQGMEFANSLEAAAADNHQGIVKKLLDRATDLNGPNVCGQTDGNPPIFAAAKYGNDEVMKLLVDRGADLNVHAQDGRTLLEFAMDQGRERVVKVILDNGADVNVPKSYELLSTAIVFKNERLVDMILNHGADINARGLSGRTALAIAAWSGLERIVEMLLNRGAKIDWNGPESPLAMASSEGNERIVQMLLERGGEAELEALNSSLVKALKRGQVKMVRMLLERGADINLRAIENALIDASSQGHESLVQLLLERGADVNQFDGERGSALTAASLGGHEEIVQLLLERGADVNQVDEVRRSNLIAASFGGNEKIVQILLERGVDVNLCDEGDNGALQCAAYRGSESIVQILLDHGAKIDCVGSIGSALQLAASEGHEDIVKLLLDRGADVNLQGGELESAIQEASSNGYDEIAQLLRERGAELNENWE